jgi:hypothetical protein
MPKSSADFKEATLCIHSRRVNLNVLDVTDHTTAFTRTPLGPYSAAQAFFISLMADLLEP